ncbi:unnamed protein product [Cuscuta europaea]|uniref:Uncharacterized protein n=1 Tax=Cuscuta europaea TaxID=41803 RepID=A0A9P0YY29_CUSEU|nr:unnamed protein product [Cuscuta europaea]
MRSEAEKKKKVALYKLLFSFADGVDVGLMILGTLGAVANGLSAPLMTLLFAQLIHAFATLHPSLLLHHISQVSIKYVYLAIGSGIASFLQMSCWMISGERQASRIRGLYLQTILRQDIAFFDTQTASGEIVGNFIQFISTFIGGFTIAYIKGWLLALILSSCIPILVIVGGLTASLMSKMSSRGQVAYAHAGNLAVQTIKGIRTVASFTGEKCATDKYDDKLQIAYKSTVQQGVASGLGLGVMSLVVNCTYALAIWYGSKLIIHNGYVGGDVINILLAIITGGTSLGQASPSLSAFAAGQAAAYKMFETINRETHINVDDSNGIEMKDMRGDIEFKDVYFTYPARKDAQIFAGFSLHVPSGKVAALVGPSGSGKSSVINLLERFYDPDSGEVIIDHINIKNFKVKWLREKMGLVSQEPFLFSTSIKENIAYGKTNATDTEITKAIELANAVEFIDKLPKDFFFGVAGGKLIQRIRSLTFKKVVYQEITWFDHPSNSSGSIGARLSVDASSVRKLVGDALALIIQNIAAILAALIIAFSSNWVLAITVLLMLPFIGLQGFVQMKFYEGFSRGVKEMYEEASQIANDAVGSIRTVVSFCAEEKVMAMYEKKCEGPLKEGIKVGIVSGMSLGIGSAVLYLATALCFYVGAILVEHDKASFAQIFKVFFALATTAHGVSQASITAPDLSKAWDSAASIFDILERKPKIDSSSEQGIVLASVRGEIELQHVIFRYPTRPDTLIFKDLCLTMPAGKTCALVGESGCGKSSVIGLLERFYDPDSGEVLLDGVAIRKLKLRWLRQQMGVVSQEPVLLNETIRDNIAYGSCGGNVTEEEMMEAANSSNAHNFISALPQGYETVVGERGVQLSGGQKQRIAIARAILKNPRVLMLDEATSALDNESERVVQEALERVSVNRTTIMVAHRLSTIARADLIAVLKNGVVTEKGRHDELLSIKDGVYASLLALHTHTTTT